MPIVAIGLSHRSCPVEIRERFAFAEAQVPAALQSLRVAGLAEEAVILSTCNRVEIYAATNMDPGCAFKALRDFLTSTHGYHEPLAGELYGFGEPQSIYHLFKVASGLDSMVLGETEILGQLKKAYDVALKAGYTGARLNRAFQRAFNVAKQIRTETNIQRGSISVASVAVELAEKIFDELRNHRVLVIGAGDTSEKTARALLSRGADSIVVTNRSYDRAATLAQALGGRAIEFDRWAEEFDSIDIVISSTSATEYILDRARLEPLVRRRRTAPLLLIDIAVPRDINPDVNDLSDVFLYNVDDLKAIADKYLELRLEEVNRCEEIIREKALALTEPRSRPVEAAAGRHACETP